MATDYVWNVTLECEDEGEKELRVVAPDVREAIRAAEQVYDRPARYLWCVTSVIRSFEVHAGRSDE